MPAGDPLPLSARRGPPSSEGFPYPSNAMSTRPSPRGPTPKVMREWPASIAFYVLRLPSMAGGYSLARCPSGWVAGRTAQWEDVGWDLLGGSMGAGIAFAGRWVVFAKVLSWPRGGKVVEA